MAQPSHAQSKVCPNIHPAIGYRPRRWISHVLTERERRFHSLRQAPGQLREGYKQAEGRLQRAGGRIKEKYAKQYEKLDQSVRPVVRKMITGDRKCVRRIPPAHMQHRNVVSQLPTGLGPDILP